jgi:hypothetical protein
MCHVILLFRSQYFESVSSKIETNLIHVLVDGVRRNIRHVLPWNSSLLVQHFNNMGLEFCKICIPSFLRGLSPLGWVQ